jgi:hypothetical protein
MTTAPSQAQAAASSTAASTRIKPPAPSSKPSGNMTYTVQKGAGSLPFLKK